MRHFTEIIYMILRKSCYSWINVKWKNMKFYLLFTLVYKYIIASTKILFYHGKYSELKENK